MPGAGVGGAMMARRAPAARTAPDAGAVETDVYKVRPTTDRGCTQFGHTAIELRTRKIAPTATSCQVAPSESLRGIRESRMPTVRADAFPRDGRRTGDGARGRNRVNVRMRRGDRPVGYSSGGLRLAASVSCAPDMVMERRKREGVETARLQETLNAVPVPA